MDETSTYISSKNHGNEEGVWCPTGGEGGNKFALAEKGEAVKSIWVFKHSSNHGTIIRGIELQFTNGKKKLAGNRTNDIKECHFKGFEALPGEVTLCKNRSSKCCGFIGIGDKLKAGDSSGRDHCIINKYDTRGRILKGIYGRAGNDIDCLGIIVTKEVKDSKKVSSTYGSRVKNMFSLEIEDTSYQLVWVLS